MRNTDSFRAWFRPIIETTGLKHKAIAAKAEIDPVSFSRILSGAQGVAKDTAAGLARAVNELAGKEIANVETAIRLAVGLPLEPVFDEGFAKGLERLSPEDQILAKRQIRAIIESFDVDNLEDDNPVDDEYDESKDHRVE